MKLADNLRTGIKSRMSLNSRKITLFTLELLALVCKKHPCLTVQSIACVIFIQSLWNLQIDRIGIKYSTSWKLGHIALFGVICPWLLAFWVSGERSLPIGLLGYINCKQTQNLHYTIWGSFNCYYLTYWDKIWNLKCYRFEVIYCWEIIGCRKRMTDRAYIAHIYCMPPRALKSFY